MSEFAAHGTDYDVVEGEPPELLGRNLSSAGHLLASATAFYFLAFLFAYFYLRSLNNAHLWHPKHVTPSLTLGTLVMAFTVLSAVLVRLGVADQRAALRSEWRLKAAVGLAVGVGAIVLQVVEWSTIGFGPADGGYASVFFGWTASNVLFVAGTLFWLQNLLATAIRYRNVPIGGRPAAGEASGDPGRPGHDVADPLSLVRPGLEALSFYWAFLAGLCVLAWVVLYLL
jgi:heme/copper-type cytochrome/quinol oxidase subunit 3